MNCGLSSPLNTSSEAWILCNMFHDISSLLSSEMNWFSSGNPCDWYSYCISDNCDLINQSIACNSNGLLTHLDMSIYAKDYESQFETSWINLTVIPQSLTFLSFENCGFYGTVDLSTFPTSLVTLNLDWNNFNMISNMNEYLSDFVNLEYFLMDKNNINYWPNFLSVLPPNIIQYLSFTVQYPVVPKPEGKTFSSFFHLFDFF